MSKLFDLDIEAISSETFKIKHDLLGTNPFYEEEEEIEEDEEAKKDKKENVLKRMIRRVFV